MNSEDAGSRHMGKNGYAYQNLPTASSIRLLELLPACDGQPRQAKFMTATLDDEPEYDCLSYVWGDRTDPGVCICDGNEVSITRSLNGFLDVYDLDAKARPIWIDSICINQDDLHELTQQVALMGRVYSQAQCVHIWLGSSDPSLDYGKTMHGMELLSSPELHAEAADEEEVYEDGAREGYWHSLLEQAAGFERVSDALRAYWRGLRMNVSIPADDEDSFVLCVTQFAKLLQHPWFSRAWTFQESMLARERQFHFGNQTCGNKNMTHAVEWLLEFSVVTESSKPEIDKAVNDDDNLRSLCFRAEEMLDSSQVGQNLISLAQLLDIRRGAVCQREQDLVFSLLGLAQDHQGVIIDYTKSLPELLYKIARSDLETSGRLDVLEPSMQSQKRQNLNADSELELTYWVPDWRLQADNFLWAQLRTNLYDCDRSKLTSISFSTDGKRLYVEAMLLAPIMYTVNLTELGSTLTDISQNALSHLRRPSSIILNTDTRSILRTYHADGQLHFAERWDSSTYEEIQSKFETKDADMSPWLLFIRSHFAMFTTNNGLLGRAPKTAQVGDVIAILWGHRVPFVLRKTPHDTYRVIGDCYVDEMMDGQAIKEEGDPGYEEYLKSLTTFVFD